MYVIDVLIRGETHPSKATRGGRGGHGETMKSMSSGNEAAMALDVPRSHGEHVRAMRGKPLKVLVLEDDESDEFLLLRELKRAGYEVDHRRECTAEGLRDALETDRWQVVISDWDMGSFTGLEAFHIVRDFGEDIPFIIVSGTLAEENAVDALRAGVHDFVTKGHFARLAPAIERELREADQRRKTRAAEAEIERQRIEVARSERLLRQVLRAVPDGVVVTDSDGNFVMWNPAAAAIIGRDVDQRHDPETWSEYHGVFMPDQKTYFPVQDLALHRALRGEAVNAQEQFLRNRNNPNGAWLSVNAAPVVDDVGRQNGAVAVLRDVSSQRRAHDQLMISDRMASLGMLAAGVGHEINNPLSAVVGNLDLLQAMLDDGEDLSESNDLKEMLADAREGARRVREIVQDLKVFSRHEEERVDAVEVIPVIQSSLRMAWNEIRHRATLQKSLEPIPLVAASDSRLGQVFLNLIINAAQAMPEGGAENHVLRVATRTDERGWAVIEVSDTGSGIEPDVLHRLFTPFFTTKPKGVGTGLGLAICDRIIRTAGGSIDVESEVGKGSTFRVCLPPAEDDVVVPSRPTRSDGLRPQARGRILLVDDEVIVASLVRRALSEHDVVSHTRPDQALEAIRAGERFDAILCDVMMPSMSGMDFHSHLTALAPDQAERLIFLSGGAFTEGARRYLAHTRNARLDKPIDIEQLRAVIRERVEHSDAEPEE